MIPSLVELVEHEIKNQNKKVINITRRIGQAKDGMIILQLIQERKQAQQIADLLQRMLQKYFISIQSPIEDDPIQLELFPADKMI